MWRSRPTSASSETLTLDGLKQAVRDVGGVADDHAKSPRELKEVKADAALGGLFGVGLDPDVLCERHPRPRGLAPHLGDAVIASN